MTARQELVFDALAKVSRRDRSAIKPEQELTADLGIDSPKSMQLLMELEEKLKVEISEEDALRMSTVGDILAFVEKV